MNLKKYCINFFKSKKSTNFIEYSELHYAIPTECRHRGGKLIRVFDQNKRLMTLISPQIWIQFMV